MDEVRRKSLVATLTFIVSALPFIAFVGNNGEMQVDSIEVVPKQ